MAIHFSIIKDVSLMYPIAWYTSGLFVYDNRQVRGSYCVGAPLVLSSNMDEGELQVGSLDQLSAHRHYNSVSHFKVDGSLSAGLNLDQVVNKPTSYLNLANSAYREHVVTERYWGFQVPSSYNQQSGVLIPWSTTMHNAKWFVVAHPTLTYWIYPDRVDVTPGTAYAYSHVSGNRFLYVSVSLGYLSYQGGGVEPSGLGVSTPQWASGIVEDLTRRFSEALLWQPVSTVTRDVLVGSGGLDIPAPVFKLPRDFLYLGVNSLFPKDDRNPNWGDLARDAYQDLGDFQGNGIALSKDLLSMKEAAISTLQTIKSLGNGRVKAIAQLYLSFHYGWKLLVSDLKELSDTLKRIDYQRKRCQSVYHWTKANATYVARYQVDYNPWSQVTSLLDELVHRFDLGLSASTAWDFIPYSFVVDWFINVGEVLTGLDNYARLERRHSVIAAGRSIKCVRRVNTSLVGVPNVWRGDVFASYYVRKYGYLIPPSLLPSVSTSFSTQHFVEAGALVVAAY